MAASQRFLFDLCESDNIPGSKLNFSTNSHYTNTQLKRWLSCRGLGVSGTRAQLLERVTSCLASGIHHILDPGLDKGVWYEKEEKSRREEQQKDGDVEQIPLLPVTGWKELSGPLPFTFTYGHIYHHIVESMQHLPCDSQDSDSDDETTDLHTSKPLRKGKLFYTSRHVTCIKTQTKSNYIFFKSKVKASYCKTVDYDVTCTLSSQSGFVKDASCTCKASSLGRCNHVCAVLFALFYYQEEQGKDGDSCTSKPRAWNVGKKRNKEPQEVHKASYDSYKKKKVDNAYNFNPMPPSLRRSQSTSEVNALIINLQEISQKESKGQPCMLATLLQLKYHDYSLTNFERVILEEKCSALVSELGQRMGFQIVADQDSLLWHLERRLRVTASKCHQILHLQSDQAKSNFVKGQLWGERVTTADMDYGHKSEPKARSEYEKDASDITPGFTVGTTGLWISPQSPELACSPDGLVMDPRQDQGNEYGLVEIKCPSTLKNCNVTDFDKVLNSAQLQRFCLERNAHGITLKQSHPYYYQVQMQMAVMNVKWCDFVVWSQKGYLAERVHFDSLLWENMKPKLIDFHHRVICPEFFEMRTPRNLLALM